MDSPARPSTPPLATSPIAFGVPMPRSPTKPGSPVKARIVSWSPARRSHSPVELDAALQANATDASARRAAHLSDVSQTAGEHFSAARDAGLAVLAERELRASHTRANRDALLELAAARRDETTSRKHERVREHNTKVNQTRRQVSLERAVRTETVREDSVSALAHAAERRDSLTTIRAMRAGLEVSKSVSAGQATSALRAERTAQRVEASAIDHQTALARRRALVAERAAAAASEFARAMAICASQREAREDTAARTLETSKGQLERAKAAREVAVDEARRRLHAHNTTHVESVQSRKANSPSKAN